MYSLSTLPVDKVIPSDKGLGFDFSAIADFVKTAATAGLGVYKNQMQLQQIKVLSQNGYNSNIPNPNGMPNPNQFGIYNSMLPMAQPYGQQLNVPQPGMYPQQSSMVDTGTMLMIGGLVVGGVLLFKILKG